MHRGDHFGETLQDGLVHGGPLSEKPFQARDEFEVPPVPRVLVGKIHVVGRGVLESVFFHSDRFVTDLNAAATHGLQLRKQQNEHHAADHAVVDVVAERDDRRG